VDIGLFLIRIVVGLLLVGHGTQKLFGWFGGHGLEGTGDFFEKLGYRPGKVWAAVAGMSETGAGLLFAFGLLTPLAAAMIIGVMFNTVTSVHGKNGLWVTDGGFEYSLVLGAVAATVAFAGPGAVALDNVLDITIAGPGWGIGALALGLGAGAAAEVYRHLSKHGARVRSRDIRATA
jgi:putative oxidoreductase